MGSRVDNNNNVISKASERKRRANKQNAQKSTGPKTAVGRARSRWNSLKHGLLAKHAVIHDYENQKEFDNLLISLVSELQPCGTLEEMLVERIADCYWNLGRIAALKHAHMTKVLKNDEMLYTWYDILQGAIIIYASRLGDEVVDSTVLEEWLFTHIKLGLIRYGVCDNIEAWKMSNEDALNRYSDYIFESTEESIKQYRTLLTSLGGIPMTGSRLQELYRYETSIENRLFKALHELERLQRLRGGQYVPAPLIIESNWQG